MNNQSGVSTKYGKLEGVYQDGIYSFRGIPYALPPTGAFRWLPPQPPKSWPGIRSAKDYGAIAPQNTMPRGSGFGPDFSGQPQSEDCLFLNIWTPGLDNAKRAVMFWIHGGAFIMGSGSEDFLDGGHLARRGDIVLVSINYRMGAAGFLNLKEITANRIPATGNEGLLDQTAALEWVRENIAEFGGNPENITIFGFSAGGMSVGTLLAMPEASGKFQKAMNRSGAYMVITKDKAVRTAELFLSITGTKPYDVDGLYRLNTQQLLDAQQQMNMQPVNSGGTAFLPVIDGTVLPEHPLTAIRKGAAKDIPVMAGNMLDEFLSMVKMDFTLRNIDEAGLAERLKKLLPGEIVPGFIATYQSEITKRGKHVTPEDIFGSIQTDMTFRIPTLRLVEAQRDQGVPVFNYLFTYPSPAMGGIMGATHGLDNPLLFGVLNPDFTGDTPEIRQLSFKIQDSCTAFARTGDPSCALLGRWPAYGTDRQTMILDLKTRVETAPYEVERKAWEKWDAISGTTT